MLTDCCACTWCAILTIWPSFARKRARRTRPNTSTCDQYICCAGRRKRAPLWSRTCLLRPQRTPCPRSEVERPATGRLRSAAFFGPRGCVHTEQHTFSARAISRPDGLCSEQRWRDGLMVDIDPVCSGRRSGAWRCRGVGPAGQTRVP